MGEQFLGSIYTVGASGVDPDSVAVCIAAVGRVGVRDRDRVIRGLQYMDRTQM